MATILCDNPPSRCSDGVFMNLSAEGPESCIEPGLARYSSEGEDIDYFLGRRLTIVEPPLGTNWIENQFLGHCLDESSQEDADICSYSFALQCLFALTFQSGEQTCCVQCPDGSDFCFTVESGKFSSLTQEDADADAKTYACQKAVEESLCLSDLETSCCTGTEFSGTIFAG